MNNGPDETVRLSEEVRHLKESVAALERRITTLEGRPGGHVARPIQDQDVESRLGLLWVNRIGAITLAFGVLFLFKYAIDKQWITIWGRVFLGVAAGAGLAAFSEWLRKRDQHVFSQGVFGCGVAIFYISLYFGLDQFRSSQNSSLAVAVISILFAVLLGVALYWRRSLLLCFNTAWAIACAALVLHRQSPDVFAGLVAVMAALYFFLSTLSGFPLALRRTLYLLGHGCLLVAVIQFLVTWVQHDIAAPNRSNMISECLSLLFGTYAVAMIIIGFARRRAIDRLLALAAIGLVVVKLYFYDVWLLDRLYRISAFVALGILLLASSYLYSRWKDKLDVLWTNETG